MNLNDYEKMIYKNMLYRKMSKLDISDDVKNEFIDSVIEEASKKFHKSFSLFLRDMFDKRLKELKRKEISILTKKEYKLILTLKELELNKTSEINYKDKKSFNTILNQVINELMKDEEKLKEAIKIYPNIKKYIISKKASISTNDLKIIEYLEKTKINIIPDNDRRLSYKIKYLSNKINSISKEIFKLYPNAYKTLRLISLGLTVKEVEIFYILKEDTLIKEKAKKLGYSRYESYSMALDKLYGKIRNNKEIREISLNTYHDIMDMIEKRDIMHHKIKVRSINKRYKEIFKKKLIVKKAPKVVSISKSYLPYTIMDDIKVNNIYLNNNGTFISSDNLNESDSIENIKELTKEFNDLTLKERYIVAIRLGYVKTSTNIDKKESTKVLHKALERRVK